MSSLFSGGVSIDVPVGKSPGMAKGIFKRMAGEIVKPTGGSSPTSIDEDKLGKIGGMMIGGTSPISGVGGHEYLNNPKYAEHREEYYGEKKKVDKFGNPITKLQEDVKKKPLPNIQEMGKGRRRKRISRDEMRDPNARPTVRSGNFEKFRDEQIRKYGSPPPRKATKAEMEEGRRNPLGMGTDYMAFLTSGKATVPKQVAEQQPVGSGYTPYMPTFGIFGDLIGKGMEQKKTNMPIFGKFELQ